MHQHLLTALHATALASTIAVSAAVASNFSEPSSTRDSSSSRPVQASESTIRFDATTLAPPLVVGVDLPWRDGIGNGDSTNVSVPADFSIDWRRIRERIDAASGSGKIVPLAFLTRLEGTSNPFEVPSGLVPASSDGSEASDVARASVQRHAIALERALVELLALARQRFPGRPLSIVGLPLEGNDSTIGPMAKVLETITSGLDVLVTDRTFLQTTDSIPFATLRSALPTVVAQADRRPVFYRTPYGWASWQPAPPGSDQPADRHPAGDEDPNFAEDVAPLSERTSADDLAIAERSWGDSGAERIRNRELPLGRDRDLADRETFEGASRVDASSSGLDESLDETPSPEVFSSDAMDFENDPLLSGGMPDTDVSRSFLQNRPGNAPVDSTSNETLDRRTSTGNSVTIPNTNTTPTLFPMLGQMSLDENDAVSLSELLSRLAGSQRSSTGDRPSTSRISAAKAPGTSTGGASGGGASSATSSAGGAAGFGSGGGASSSGGGGGGGAAKGPSLRPRTSPAPKATDSPTEPPTTSASNTSRVADVASPIDASPPAPSVPSGPSAASTPTIVIPIDASASPPLTTQPATNDDNPPSADVPASSTWNPSSGVTPTTPIASGGASIPPSSQSREHPYQFGQDVDDPIWAHWACAPFRSNDGRLWIGVSAFAPQGIDSVRFLVSGLGATSVANVEYHPDRGLDAYWIDVKPGDVSGSQVAVTAVVNTNGVADPLESPPIVVAKRRGDWDVQSYKSGWLAPTPSADSRLIYVAANGNDAAAANNQHGRAYYLPSDPEIGADPMNPVGPIVAYATHFEAAKRVRLSKASGEDANGFPIYASGNATTGYPDWILLRRGDAFLNDPLLAHPNSNVEENYNLGMLLGGRQQSTIGWDQSRGRLFYTCGPWRGRSESEPSVVTSWGTASDPRPVLSGFTICGEARHLRVTSVEVQGAFSWGWGADTAERSAGDVLIEDVKATSLGGLNSVAGPNYTYQSGLTIRRSVVADTFSPNGHNQGFFFRSPLSTLTIEECVFDRNGYKEDPNEPTTWTADIVSYQGDEGGLPVGTGVQQKRSYFDRNLYLTGYGDCTLRGNIVSRGGGGSSVQMRNGGVAERNLFLWNQAALGMAHPEGGTHDGSLVRQNVVLHDDMFLPPGGWGTGLGAGGWSDDVAVLEDNIVTHFHRGNNGLASITAYGKSYSSKEAFTENLSNAFILNNAIYREHGGIGIEIPPTTHPYGVLAATVDGNAVSTPDILSLQGDPSKPATYTYANNRFHTDIVGGRFRFAYHENGDNDWRRAPYTNGTLSDWQAAGYDTDATVATDFAAFKASVGWIEPERDILSYMQAVDPTYVVNEDVYVDDGSTGQKQAVRQRVWEVLMRDTGRGNFDEARAKKVARRYHAFLAFIEKARANRKGAWDSRWTADAVNNYIREGYGKTPVAWGRN